MRKEEINSNVFLTVNEVVFGINEQRLVVAYYPNISSTETVGVSLDEHCKINVDHLPRNGYSISNYDPDQYGNIFWLFRNGIYTFEESMFLDPKKFYDVLFLETGAVHRAKVTVVPCGVGKVYQLDYVSAELQNDYFSRESYGKMFVISK